MNSCGGGCTFLQEQVASRPGMSESLSRIARRVAYAASQLPRIAWYVGHSLAVYRLAAVARERHGGVTRQRAHTKGPVPDRGRLYADMAELFLQDLANVEAGLYPLPAASADRIMRSGSNHDQY